MVNLRAWVRFHIASGLRPALRAAALEAVVLAVAVGSSDAPGETLRQIMLGLSGGGGWRAAPVLFALWAAADAHRAARRLAPALGGWHLHLPGTGALRRRAFLLALAVAQAPALGIWIGLWLVALLSGEPARLASLAAPPLVALGAGLAMLPLRRTWARLPGLAALSLAALAAPLPILGAAFAVVLAEAIAGPMRAHPPRRSSRAGDAAPRLLPAWIFVRALGPRLLTAALGAALPAVAAWLFLRNNVLAQVQIGMAARTGCGLSILLIQLQLAGHLRSLRPPWAWSRSLPWSSRTRVLHDAALLSLCALPALVAGGSLAPGAAPPLVVLALFCALHLTAALRRPGGSHAPLGAADVATVVIATLAVGVTAWGGAVLLLLLPWTGSHAARRERAMKVSLWNEQHHDLAGDPT